MISAATVAAAAAPKGRRLQDGEAPQLYVTRGNDMLATQAGKSIGEAIADVRGSPCLPPFPGVYFSI